jgi:hypothetical protein
MSGLEHTKEKDSVLYDLFSIISNVGNKNLVSFGCEDAPFQLMFNAFRPIDFSWAQTCSPLLDMHMKEVAVFSFV